jgi:hypothetical protein
MFQPTTSSIHSAWVMCSFMFNYMYCCLQYVIWISYFWRESIYCRHYSWSKTDDNLRWRWWRPLVLCVTNSTHNVLISLKCRPPYGNKYRRCWFFNRCIYITVYNSIKFLFIYHNKIEGHVNVLIQPLLQPHNKRRLKSNWLTDLREG